MACYRIVAWQVDETGCKSIIDIREVEDARTISGTRRKLGRHVLDLLNDEGVDHLRVEIHPQPDDN